MSQFLTDSHLINAVPVIAPSNSHVESPQKSSNRIRLRDSRDLYLLIGECRALGADGLAWRRHLTERLHAMLEADLVSFVDCRVVANPHGDSEWLQTFSKIERNSLDTSHESPTDALVSAIRESGRLTQALYDYRGTVVASTHDPLLGVDWSRMLSRQCSLPLARAGQSIVGIDRSSGENLQLLYIFRQSDRPTFSHRVVHLLRALWVELRLFQPAELRCVKSSVFLNYPRRMLQVLSCLLAGSTAKETATLLSISVHTVQEHIKRLYKRTSTSNRAELAEFFREVAPQLLETPLDQFPD